MTSDTPDPRHHRGRRAIKTALGAAGLAVDRRPPSGATLLIYHRLGAGTPDELDVASRDFAEQVELLQDAPVRPLDDAYDHVSGGNLDHQVVLTFDDGFRDVFHVAWPLLRRAGMPFTIYLAAGYVDRVMRWPGSTAVGEPGHGLTWDQLREMLDSGLLTVANHTHDHVRPEDVDAEQLDRCTETIERELGVTTEHFAYTWGVPTPHADAELRARFRTAATGHVGRNTATTDPLRWHRVPVRGSDPATFFRAKLVGRLGPETAYQRLVDGAKSLRTR